jgi:hypothetical protein
MGQLLTWLQNTLQSPVHWTSHRLIRSQRTTLPGPTLGAQLLTSRQLTSQLLPQLTLQVEMLEQS